MWFATCSEIETCLSLLLSHIGQLRTFVDPRLITGAVYDHPDRYGVTFHTSIRNKFRSLARATEVLQDVNLSQKVAIVTGANSGLGEGADCYLLWMLFKLAG